MDQGRIGRPKVVGRHHPPQCGDERALWIREEARDPRQGLFFLGIKNVQNGADQQRVRRLLPMVAPLERPFGIDQDVGDILDVADLVRAAADLEQRIVARRTRIGRIEQQAVREARAPAGGQRPVLALDVVDDRRAGPTQKGRHDQPDALARAGRGEGHDMLGTVMAQIAAIELTQENTGIAEQARALDFARRRPARGAVGGDVARLARAPERAEHGRSAADEAARGSERPGLVEDVGRIGLVMIPPGEERPGPVDRQLAEPEPGQPELRLVGEHRGGPLRRRPQPKNHDREHDQDLSDQELGGGHAGSGNEDSSSAPEIASNRVGDQRVSGAASAASTNPCARPLVSDWKFQGAAVTNPLSVANLVRGFVTWPVPIRPSAKGCAPS